MDTNGKEKKKIRKRKKELSIEQLVENTKKLTKDEVVLLLSGIAKGEIRDFTGLAPSLEVRIKAMDKLLPLISTEVDENIKEIHVTITDASNDNRIETIEQKIKGGNDGVR